MDRSKYLEFKLYHVRMFLALGRCLNYTRAAAEYHVSQSTMSRSIKQFEALIGMHLFERDTTKVALTPAGKSLFEDLRDVLTQVECSIIRAKDIQENKKRTIVIGMSGGLDVSIEIDPYIRKYKEDHPRYKNQV